MLPAYYSNINPSRKQMGFESHDYKMNIIRGVFFSTHSMLQWDEPLISPIGLSLQDCGPSITKSKLHSLKIKFETRMLSFLWHYYHMKHCIKLNCLLLRSFEKNWSINISIFVSVYPFYINNLLLVMYQIEVWKTTFHFSNLYSPLPQKNVYMNNW